MAVVFNNAFRVTPKLMRRKDGVLSAIATGTRVIPRFPFHKDLNMRTKCNRWYVSSVLLGVLLFFLVPLGACASINIFPEGFHPWTWIVVVDGKDFLAFPYARPSAVSKPFTVPPTAAWRPMADLESVQREHWDPRKTAILVYPMTEHEAELSTFLNLTREAKINAVPTTAVKTMQTFLNSIPRKPE